MDMLSEVSELNKGTLYYYYSSKPDILFDLCVATTDRHYRVVSAASKMSNPVEGLRYFVETTVLYIDENRDRCRVFYQEEHFFDSIFDAKQLKNVRQQQRKFMKNFYDVLSEGVSQGVFRPMDIRTAGRLIYGSIMTAYRWREEVLDTATIISEIDRLVLSGLLVRN